MRQDDRSWSDLVFWRSAEEAERMKERAASSEVCRAYFSCMSEADQDPGAGLAFYRSVEVYGNLSI
jgi:hypothetical protein